MELNNDNIRTELKLSSELGHPTQNLMQIFITITDRVIYKPNFKSLFYKDEMRLWAINELGARWKKMNIIQIHDPFAYFVQVVTGACLWYINHEYKR